MTTPTDFATARRTLGLDREYHLLPGEQRAHEAAFEVDGPDPILDAAPDWYGDVAAGEAENRATRQADRALGWLEGGGVR